MTIVLIIVCIVFCVGVVLAILSHLGFGMHADRGWRRDIGEHHDRKNKRGSAAV